MVMIDDDVKGMSSNLGVANTFESNKNSDLKKIEMKTLITEQINCVPKNYRVKDKDAKGLFQLDKAEIEINKQTTFHNDMPTIYDLKDVVESDDDPDDDDVHQSFGKRGKTLDKI